MLKQLVLQSLNGFTVKDIPFLILQLAVAALLTMVIRFYWRKKLPVDALESQLVNYILVVQLILTTIAIFSIQSPWLSILFGIFCLLPFIGINGSMNFRSRIYFLIICFISFGCGAVNLAITTLIVFILIIPLLHFHESK